MSKNPRLGSIIRNNSAKDYKKTLFLSNNPIITQSKHIHYTLHTHLMKHMRFITHHRFNILKRAYILLYHIIKTYITYDSHLHLI